jgi:hypothetical protein
MNVLTIALLLQLPAQPAPPAAREQTLPVLAFPEPGMDDSAAYQGYRTRFYRDSKGNTVQIYIDQRVGRVVQVWGNAANESVGFTARDGSGRPAALAWGAEAADVSESGAVRTIEYRLAGDSPALEVGWFVLGSMRVERDFQYARAHLRPFTAPPFRVAEESSLVASVGRLPAAERKRHLAQLGAGGIAELKARLDPTIRVARSDTAWVARVHRPSLDGRNRLALELSVDPRQVEAQLSGRTVRFRGRPGATVILTVRTSTDATPLTPLAREAIFTPEFLEFLARARAAHDSVVGTAGTTPPRGADSAVAARYRWLERQVRSVELLSSEEKLMAGMPNYATYFGRDMMMSALMMRSIWTPAMAEHVVASVLRKLSPAGEVSHEEALGGQAIREHAVEYDSLVGEHLRLARSGRRPQADSALARAGALLDSLQAVRENYRMMDDEFHLPVLAAGYLADASIPAARKRAFLLAGSRGGASHLALLVRELAHVATMTAAYAREPVAGNLVAFPKRTPTRWFPGSWRDSNVGYANGRFAMDINAIWAPRALASIAEILAALREIGIPAAAVDSLLPERTGAALAAYVRDSAALGRAVRTWYGAGRHFAVAIGPREIEKRVRAKLAWLPAAERRYWEQARSAAGATDSLRFLALSLDSAGRPIPVVNTDPATRLFLEPLTADVARGALPADSVLGEVEPFVRPYPAGLFVERLGPVVANDAYASRGVWEDFREDTYHSPRVVWGREVNLLLLGLARQIAPALDASGRPRDPALASYVGALDDALRRTLAAVEGSGFKHSELWSYRIEGGELIPTRYGISTDLQLWSTTDLAVQFMLSRIPHRIPQR